MQHCAIIGEFALTIVGKSLLALELVAKILRDVLSSRWEYIKWNKTWKDNILYPITTKSCALVRKANTCGNRSLIRSFSVWSVTDNHMTMLLLRRSGQIQSVSLAILESIWRHCWLVRTISTTRDRCHLTGTVYCGLPTARGPRSWYIIAVHVMLLTMFKRYMK